MNRYSSPLLQIIIICLLIAGCGGQYDVSGKLQTINGLTMGTSYSVKYIPIQNGPGRQAISSGIEDLLQNLNQRMSTYINDSELSLINQNKNTDWINISDDLFVVLKTAQEISQLTDGAFDITIGPLVNLWGFGPEPEKTRIPDRNEIEHLLKNTGYEHISLREELPAIKKSLGNIYIDLSAIAKGYAVDQIAALLDKHNINNYLVEIGGEIKASGINDKQVIWRIGIEKPLYDDRDIQHIIELDNVAMATSGDYRNYFEIDGSRYSHTIDPVTGRPVTHQLASVTIIDPSAMKADALATAIMVMGTEKGFTLAQQNHLAALLITRDTENNAFTSQMTTDFKHYLAH